MKRTKQRKPAAPKRKRSLRKRIANPPKRAATSTEGRDPAALALLLIVAGNRKEAVIKGLIEHGVSAKEANEIVAEASNKICLAAEWSRDEQAGLMMLRLNELYSAAWSSGQLKEALYAQKELNRVLGLHKSTGATEGAQGGAEAQGELDAVRGYLEPLGLAPEGTEVSELARLAVSKLARPDEAKKT